MIWIALGCLWVSGAVATAYLIGRFTNPDYHYKSSEIRELAPFLIPLWPIAAVIFGIVFPVLKTIAFISTAAMVSFKVGDNHRIEWEARMKMLAPHVADPEKISSLETDIERMAREASQHWDERA